MPSGDGVKGVSASGSRVTTPRSEREKSGNRDMPTAFLALGQEYTDTAIFERISGDVVGYCQDFYIEDQPFMQTGTFEWGIRIPVCMRQSKRLAAVQLYYLIDGDHTVSIYTGESIDGAVPVYTKTWQLTGFRGWRTLELDSVLSFAPEQTVWITITASDTTGWGAPIAAGSYSGNPDGAWYRFDDGWDFYHPIGGYYTWMIRAVLDNAGNADISDRINDATVRIYVNHGRIVVEGTNDEVRVFDIMGRLVPNDALPFGVYMVKVGTAPARKVVVTR